MRNRRTKKCEWKIIKKKSKRFEAIQSSWKMEWKPERNAFKMKFRCKKHIRFISFPLENSFVQVAWCFAGCCKILIENLRHKTSSSTMVKTNLKPDSRHNTTITASPFFVFFFSLLNCQFSHHQLLRLWVRDGDKSSQTQRHVPPSSSNNNTKVTCNNITVKWNIESSLYNINKFRIIDKLGELSTKPNYFDLCFVTNNEKCEMLLCRWV